MNTHIKYLCRMTFKKIFKNLAKEMNVEVSKIQLGVCFENGTTVYEAYNDFKKVKNIDLANYCNLIDAGLESIKSSIGEAGVGYTKELGCKASEINIIMQNNEGKLPMAVLLKNNKKIRNIDIAQEF